MWLVCGLIDEKRDEIILKLNEIKIDSRPFFYSLGEMPVYKKYLKSNRISKMISSKGICLPIKILGDEGLTKIKKIRDVLS